MGYVWVIDVDGRMDGLYVFTDEDDADRFRDAVIEAGGDCVKSTEPLLNSDATDELVADELEEED
jgi:hypothetical protein